MGRPFSVDDIFQLRIASDPQISPGGERVAFVVTIADRERDRNGSTIWIVPTAGGTPTQLTQGPADGRPRWSPNGTRLAFLRTLDEEKPQIWILPLAGGEASPLTAVEHGVAEFEWSPDGRRVAYATKVDPASEAGASEAPAQRPIVVRRLRYKADGSGLEDTRRRHLHVVDAVGGEPKQLTSGDFHVSFLAWAPDCERIAYVAAPHDTADVDWITHLFVVGAAGGEPLRVTDWSGSAFAPAWSADGATLVFIGSTEPIEPQHSHLFAVPATGGVPKNLCPELDRNVMLGAPGYPGTIPRITGDGTILFCARDRGYVQIYALEPGGVPRKIVGGLDRLASNLSVVGDRMAMLVSSPTIPADIFVATTDGSDEHRLTLLNDELLWELDLYTPEERIFTAADGEPVHGWMIRGRSDGPGPLLLDIHGGPHNAWAPNFGSNGRLYHQILAAQGWTILLVNSRGSDGYGEQFFKALEEGWGTLDMQDFIAAVESLVEEGVADPARLAVTGNSYGGYMTNWLVSHTDRFAAAVTAGCVTNLQSMYGTSDLGSFLGGEMGAEMYEARELYARLSPITYVENVSTPVLIIHGLSDDRCPVSQAEEWFASLRMAGKTVEMVLYPESTHLFLAIGRPSHRIDACTRLIEWVRRYTKTEMIP